MNDFVIVMFRYAKSKCPFLFDSMTSCLEMNRHAKNSTFVDVMFAKQINVKLKMTCFVSNCDRNHVKNISLCNILCLLCLSVGLYVKKFTFLFDFMTLCLGTDFMLKTN